MPNYKYKALLEDGRVQTGNMVADSQESLISKLESDGLHVVKATKRYLPELSHKPSIEDVLYFIKELGVLLRAGISVPDALRSIAESRNDRFGNDIAQIRYSILRGGSLSQAFSKYSSSFGAVFISLLTAGEKGGKLVESLVYYEKYLRQKLSFKRKLRQALIYPLFILGIVTVILFVIFGYSLPRFVEIYADLDSELPAATQYLLSIADNFGYLLVALATMLLSFYMLVHHIRNNKKKSYVLDRLKLRAPVVGALVKAYLASFLGRELSILLSTGIPLIEALSSCAKNIPNSYISAKLHAVIDDVARGSSFTKAMTGFPLFTPTTENIVRAGDRSGTLPEQLTEMAQFCEEDLEHRLEIGLSLLEPILILVTGIIVGGIVIAMYLPIFSMAEAVS